jgi:drug/metabolite transporter (DMT)-like permease
MDLQSIILGILASLFFAVTFVINRSMDLSGGSWIWSASLRYIFMIPFLFVIVSIRGNLAALFSEMKARPWAWLLWSIVGFGLFYAPLCIAASYGPSWLVAGTWQLTIVAGSLLVPFFYDNVRAANQIIRVRKKLPVAGLGMSLIILLGIVLMQAQHAAGLTAKQQWLGILPVLVAAFAYPLGNRKMMEVCVGRLDAYQRVLGMTLASLPLWFVLCIVGFFTVGAPSVGQTEQSLLVAISSGVIATVLFFTATDQTRGNPGRLAAVEATQSMEVIFSVIGEMWFLSGMLPNTVSLIGMVVVMIGMALHSFVSHGKPGKKVEIENQSISF